MALQKQPVRINFSQGLDTKTDPNQVPIGRFLNLENTVFDTAGRLTKRNGFANITKLPNTEQTTLTTLNDNLLATGSNLYAYSSNTDEWLDQGPVQPISLDTTPIVRSSANQTSVDCAVSSSGLACLVYAEGSSIYYQLTDSTTGQQVVSRTALPATAKHARVFVLNKNFIITFLVTVAGLTHLRYIAVPISNPGAPKPVQDISAVVESLDAGYDAVVSNNNIYFGWASSSTTVSIAYMTSTLVVSASIALTGSHYAKLVSLAVDTTQSSPVLWISFWDNNTSNGYSAAFSPSLAQVLAPTQIITGQTLKQITSVAASMSANVFYEVYNTYNYAPNAQTDYVESVTVSQAGTVGTPSVILRSVGLASKAFIAANDNTYMLVTYGEVDQPTYFLIDSTGSIYMRLAYSNGGGYIPTQVLPNVTEVSGVYFTPYLFKDFLTTVNKGTNNPAGTPSNALYTQTGVNLAKFTINSTGQYSSEIARTLHLTGGQLWMYDSIKPVEHGFHVWPENIAITTATGSGSITADTYYYVFCYEWTDNQGLLHRSAPSIPVKQITTTSSSTNTIKVPTLRLTAKTTPNPVRIVGYRWSVSQQVYYQFTSITTPVLNDPSVDNVTITDTLADSAILGNTILYTTGGVVENIAAPANTVSTLFKNRLFVVDAEDRNLIWFSKQVIENTPVEMSDLFTIYVAPTIGTQGSTGGITALASMDDKLIIFKNNAIYYMTGIGPDNTGANNDFSDPVFITSSVGCDNPNSIILMQSGLMFQSSKGIWLLSRDLQTNYIGASVESYNSFPVMSVSSIPNTNQIRFIISNGKTLMYDYFYNQWATFTNTSAISATIFQDRHTYLNVRGQVFQETPGEYLDGSVPVLMSFTTSWMNVAGLRGYERFYFMYLLGKYITPFKLNVQLAYDYNTSVQQAIIITPDNYSPPWGADAVWGSGEVWGGPGNVFSARIFPEHQKCETVQITMNEIYDPSKGVTAGAGLTLSGLNIVIGVKKGYPTQKASQSFG